MSIDFYFHIGAVALQRKGAIHCLMDFFHETEASHDVTYDQLEVTNGKIEYSGEEAECRSLIQAITDTADWDGFEIGFTYQSQLCSAILVFPDDKTSQITFSWPARLFTNTLEQAPHRLASYCRIIIDRFQGNFCILEPGWIQRSRTIDDISKWLSDTEKGIPRDWEILLMRQSVMPYERIMGKQLSGYMHKKFGDEDQFWMAQRIR